jgi:cobalt-zinc-cadmium efflux system membrane fusion protein
MNLLNLSSKWHLIRVLVAQLALFLLAFIVWIGTANAGEGHDHGDKAPAASAGAGSPRVASHSDLFELVGIVDKGEMTLYLDRHPSNEPVLGATIEVEAGAAKGIATAQADGTYRFKHPLLAQPGTLAVSFTVIAGKESDLLAGDLKLDDPHAGHAHDEAARPWLRWLAYGGTALALLAIAFLAARRLRRPARL